MRQNRKVISMKRVIGLLLVLLLPPYLHPIFGQGTSPLSSGTHAEADLVMNRYFDALVNGDVITLKTLLGGDLEEKRAQLLNNPDYGSYLINTYMNAEFQILGYHNSGPDTIAIDVLISFSRNEFIRKRYLLKKTLSENGTIPYLITHESSISTDSF